MTDRRRIPASVVLAATLLVACGGDEDRVALAITGASWNDDGRLELTTECATITEVPWVTTVGDEPPTITLWGRPKTGRCEPVVEIDIAPGVTKVVDAATSQVVDLPPQADP